LLKEFIGVHGLIFFILVDPNKCYGKAHPQPRLYIFFFTIVLFLDSYIFKEKLSYE